MATKWVVLFIVDVLLALMKFGICQERAKYQHISPRSISCEYGKSEKMCQIHRRFIGCGSASVTLPRKSTIIKFYPVTSCRQLTENSEPVPFGETHL